MIRSVLFVLSMLIASQALAQNSGLVRLTDRDDLLGWEAVGRLDLAGRGHLADLVLGLAELGGGFLDRVEHLAHGSWLLVAPGKVEWRRAPG